VPEALALNHPVLLARLKRAREDRAYSQERVAEYLGVARTTIVAIEAGQRQLQPHELVALAEMYDEPLEALLRSSPEPRPLAAQFRVAAGRMPEQRELREAARDLQRLGEDYLELESLLGLTNATSDPPAHLLHRGDPAVQGEQLAEEERRRLGLGDGPLPHLREVLENDARLRVFAMLLPSRIAGLFGYDAELGACVAINAQHRWERQRWSLAHEYAHFLTRRDIAEVTIRIDERQRIPAHERFADAFARNFLMSPAGVTRRWRSAIADTGKPTAALLVQQADYWGVSFQAFCLHLESLKLLRSGALERFRARKFKVDEARELLALGTHEPDMRLLPRRFRLLAATAFSEGEISEERLAHLLREDRVTARRSVAALLDLLAPEG
jgi:Zn-dependent peptidase ImmA (M78 family)/transcriptional regulator with XRE-family HTH domain